MAKIDKYRPLVCGLAAIALLVIAISMITTTFRSHEVATTSYARNHTWLNSPNDIINSIAQIHRIKESLIVIDPGHGGDDPGAIYPYDKTNHHNIIVKEKDLNLDISLKLGDLLRKSGIKVQMTRNDDINLKTEDRGELANRLNAALLVSIHNNYYKASSSCGTMTYFNPSIDPAACGISGQRAAELVQTELIKKLGTYDNGVKELIPRMKYSNTKMPIVLAEVAYISNESDRQNLSTEQFRTQAAQGLYEGIMKILSEMAAPDAL